MKKIIFLLSYILLISTSLFASDESVSQWDSRWTLIQQKSPDLDLRDHWYVCSIKFRLRSYSDLFICLDRLKERTSDLKDDNYKKSLEPIFSGWMRSSALLELGMHEEAKRIAIDSLVVAKEFIQEDGGIRQLTDLTLMGVFVGGGVPGLPSAADYFNSHNNPARVNLNHALVVAGLNSNVAIASYIIGDTNDSEKHINNIILIGDSKHGLFGKKPHGLHALTVMPRPFFATKQYSKALEAIKKIQELENKNKGPTIPISGAAGIFVAVAILNPRAALETVFRATSESLTKYLTTTTGYESHLDKISNDFMYGVSNSRVGDLAFAQNTFDKLLEKPEIQSLGGLYWQILYERGLIALNKGETDIAIKYFKDSAEAIEKVRSSISIESAKIGFSGDKQAVYQELVKVLSDKGDWQGVFEYAERAKARALVDLLSQQDKFATPPNIDLKIMALLEKAEMQEEPMPILESHKQTRAISLAARQELSKAAPEVASLLSVSPVKIEDIAAKLSPEEALVNYFNAGDSLYALVMNGVAIKGYKLDANGLEEEVRTFRKSLEKSDSAADEQGKKLYSRLIAPLLGELKGKKVTFSPHAALHYLPFGALHDGNKYLVEEYSIRVMPSANALAYVRTDKPSKPGKLLALGNPDLNDNSLDLPASQNEANQVASLFPLSKALVRKEASKEAVKELGNGFSILHIASHGHFDANKPLNSGLLLAGNGPNEGRLTVSDLYKMRLDIDLVTLSACETGLGKVASGDDVVGLNRGFLYAGARSIVSSLWQVDDEATENLMTFFYKNLAKKMEQREALRLAQIETKKTFPHPFYWAAFQITGSAN